MLSKQEFISKIETEARDLLTRSEFDDYRQAQIDDEYYHFTDGRKVRAFLDTIYPIYASRMETKELDREYNEYRSKFLKVLSDSTVTDGLVESYRVMKNNVRATQFDGYIKEELKKHKSGENRILKFWNENESVPDYSLNRGFTTHDREQAPVIDLDRGFTTHDRVETGFTTHDKEEVSYMLLSSSLSEEVLHATRVSVCGIPHTVVKPQLSSLEETSETQEPKEYKPSKYGFDMSEFSSGRYLPWVKSRDLQVTKGVYVPDYIASIKSKEATDGYVAVEVSEKLETCLRQAVASQEWSSYQCFQPAPGRNAEKQVDVFIERTLALFSHSRATRTLSLRKIQAITGGGPQAKMWLEIIQTPYTIKGKQYRLMTYLSSVNGKANFANWDPYLYTAHIVKRNLVTKPLLRACTTFHSWQKQMCASYPALYEDQRMFLELSVPSRESVIAYLDTLVDCGHKHKGRTLTDETRVPRPSVKPGDKTSDDAKLLRQLNRQYVWKEDWVQTYDNACDKTRIIHYTRHRDRHYGPYVELASEVRKMFLFNGKPLAWLDYSSMHPTLLLMRFMDQGIPAGYETEFFTECRLINRILGIDRDVIANPEHDPRSVMLEIFEEMKSKGEMGDISITSDTLKIAQLSFYNQRISSATHTMLGKFYASVLPLFSSWLNDMKGLGDCNNKVVSRWLLHKESELMESVAAAIREKGIRCISAHDGIDVDPDFAWQAERIFREKCIEFGLPPNVTCKS